MKRFLKLMHEIGGIGMAGALAAHLVILVVATPASPEEYAAIRQAILAITRWLLLPSLLIVLLSGLLAMAVHYPFCQTRWVWAKALTGIALLEGTLITVQGTSRQIAEITARAAAGTAQGGDAEQLVALLRTEWIGVWTILLLCLLNVVLAVLRPRLQWPDRRPATATAPAAQRAAPPARSVESSARPASTGEQRQPAEAAQQ